jgi:hypothetical protein
MLDNAFGPILCGWVYQLYGVHVVFLGCVATSLLAILFFKQALPSK